MERFKHLTINNLAIWPSLGFSRIEQNKLNSFKSDSIKKFNLKTFIMKKIIHELLEILREMGAAAGYALRH